MGRRKRSGFADVATTRAAFERAEGRCPKCRRPIGPKDDPRYIRDIGGLAPRLATLRCGRCSAELTVHFEEDAPA